MNNPFDFFDHIICVNLDERTDRWQASLEQFDLVGIKDRVERFSAIKSENGRNGCGMSHIEVVKLCKDNNYKTPLIFEDDVSFLESPNFVKENMNIMFLHLNFHKSINTDCNGTLYIPLVLFWSTFYYFHQTKMVVYHFSNKNQ